MRRAALALALVSCSSSSAAPATASPTAIATPTSPSLPSPTATATTDPVQIELRTFFAAYRCPELEAKAKAVRDLWELARKLDAKNTEAAATAQRELVASTRRLPDTPAAREFRMLVLGAEQAWLDAIVAYQHYLVSRAGADLQEHQRLVAEHDALVDRIGAKYTEVVLSGPSAAAALSSAAPDCSFLR